MLSAGYAKRWKRFTMNEEETFEETVQNFQQINKIHWNLEQNVIITTEDKLKLCSLQSY